MGITMCSSQIENIVKVEIILYLEKFMFGEQGVIYFRHFLSHCELETTQA